ncbi:hypothetical protein ABPG74_018422 [Tetrahymena malaccensis]
MKRVSHLIQNRLYLFLIFIIVSKTKQFYQLTDGITNIDCDNSLNSRLIQGIDIFQNIDMNNPVSILNISGWIFLRGFKPKYYTIFSVHQGNSQVFSLSYTLIPSPKMKVSLYSAEQITDYPFLTQKQWLFFMAQIQYNTISLDLSENIYLLGNNINVSLPQLSLNTNIIHFDKNNLFINFGQPGNSLSLESSCSFTRDFVIVWDNIFQQNMLGARRYDLSDFKTYILWNYDLFYIKSNQGQLVSQQLNQSKIKSPFIYRQNDNQGIFEILRAGQIFATDFINVSDVQGLTFSFQVFLANQIVSDIQMVTLISENIQFIFGFNKDYQFTLNIIENGNKQEQKTPFKVIQVQEWTQVLMILKIGQFQKVDFLINSNNSRFRLIKINKNVQIKFGSRDNQIDLKFNNIYIVKGTYLGYSIQCSYLLPTNQCLYCNSAYFLDYQNNMDCVDQSTVTQNPDGFNQMFWDRTECGKDQLNAGNNCICRSQFYKQGNECVRCPSYCNGCIDSQTCKQKDINRNNQGNCQSGYFDDGFNCILSTFSIQDQNLALNYLNSQYNCNLNIADSSLHTFDNNLMQILQNQSIFYSFSFSLTQQPADYSVVSILSDNGIDIFTILIVNQKIHLYILGNDAVSIEFKQSETTWIGVYTNWNVLQLFVFTEAQVNVKSALISPQITINSPKICVGSCYSTSFPKYICANLGERPFILIKDIPPIQEKTDILFLISRPLIKIAQFRSIQSSFFPEQIVVTNQNQKIFINFQESLKQIDEFKGFLLDQNTQGQIILDTTYQSPITFSTSIFIAKMEKTVLLLSYGDVQYYLVPQEDLNRIYIRICFKQDCVDSNYSSLNFNEPNFILILYRNQSPFTTDYSFLQFEVYCNYKREKLNIVQPSYQVSFISNLVLGSLNQLDEASIFLNNISLYTGDGYLYPDYTNLNNCFIYANISPKECLFAKQDHLVIDRQIITAQECLDQNKNYFQNQGYYQINPITKQCFFKCLIQNAFPDQRNNCVCNNGYFLSVDQAGNKQCKKCSNNCKTCLNYQDNCLECQNENLKPPQCSCPQDNYYLDRNNQCQMCSIKCKTCEANENNCIACAKGRINPPLCECDESEYDLQGNQCLKRNCSKKCQKCQQDLSTCTQCSKFRENPPICNCQYGYFQDINENCIKCNFNEYFDYNFKICIQCLQPCLTCSQINSNCQSCINGYILDGNVCKCPNGNISQISEKGDIYCLELMYLTCQIKFQQNRYKVILQFEHILNYFDVEEKSKQIEIISVYIPQIDKSAFSTANYQIDGDILSFDFLPKTSFQALSAKFYIRYPQIFVSSDNKFILSDKYAKKPIEFQIGPYIILQQMQETQAISSVLDTLNDKNTIVDIFQKFQLTLYLLNTVQPSALFLLLNAKLPPNLYQFLQLFGIFIYPKVQNYQQKPTKTKFSLLGIQISEDEVYPHCKFTYSKLGFSNSLLVNISIILLKYFLIVLAYVLVTLFTSICYYKSDKQIFFKIQTFLFQRLNNENEINLLMVTLSILIQFECIESDSWYVRNSIYAAILFIILIVIILFFNYKHINYQDDKKKSNIAKGQISENKFQFFTERLKKSENTMIKNYFFIQMIKKYIQVFILVIFEQFPQLSCIVCGTVSLISFIQTIEDKLSQQTIFDSDLVENYLTLGKGINYQQLNYDQKFQQQRIINSKQLYFGNFLFQNSDSTQFSISQFTITGWFFLRCGGIQNNYLFSFMFKGQQILGVSFNLAFENVIQTFISSNQDQIVNNIAFNNWFLIKSQISIQNSQIIAQTSVHSYGNLFLANIAALPQNFNQILSKIDITLEIGNSSQQTGVFESCAYSKNVYIYWDENIDDSQTQNYVDDFTALQTQLVWNFDFFYTKVNPKSYVNIANPAKINPTNYDLSGYQILLVKSTTVFKTDYVNPLDFGGLVITFHFKIPSLSFTNLKLFQILNQQVQISISVDSSSNIYLNTQQIQGVSLNQWNQITLVIKTLIINEAYLIVNTFDNLVQKITLNQQFLLGQLQFGDSSNTLDIQFSHIRYYKGAFLTSNKGNCLLQDSRNTVSCIICQSGYFINYQGSLTCSAQTLPSINVNKDNIIDWNENFQSCPQGMVYDPITYKCSCLNQFYMKSDNTCAKCPSYCNGCINQTTCLQQDEQRLGNGACQQGYFDDGYSCINQKLTIFSQTNIVKIFSIPNLNPICSQSINPTDYTLTESLLNLSQQNSYSFQFSFSYFFKQFKDNYSFAVFQDGANEIFTFSVSQTTSYQFINFEIQGQIVYKVAIQTGQAFWIVFWTNVKSITLLFQSQSQFIHTTIKTNLNINLSNPQFCVGPCKSAYHPAGYLCGDLEHRPLMFIRNITNPIYDLITLQMFLSNPTVNVALFKVSLFSDLTQIFKNQLAQNPSLTFDFQNTPVQIHKLKGFGFTKQVKAVIQNINISGYYWISFYCSILPVTINSQTSLLSYPLNGGFVEYFLVPHGQKILIRICYITQCIDSKYSMLNLNESNHLFILMRHQSPFSGGIHFIEFDVICNYMREQIQFLSVSFSQSMPTISLNIGLQTLDTEDFLFYLNLINIDKGDGLYYFDYNPSQNCFIFQQIDQMNCIYYKNNLISYQNSMITVQKCQSYNNNQPKFFIPNLQTRECINSLQTFPDCLTVDLVNNNLKCTQCIKNNADPFNDCSCIEGYYLDNSTNLCLKCNPICQACQNSKNNCTKCKYSNQITPTCDCHFPNYFLDQNLSCQKCSQQCETCTTTKDSCLTCSYNRIDPPLCQCDNLNYIEINGICTKIICDYKCNKCQFDISSNSIICLKCKSGRQNLPQCTCMKNYAENDDGTCSPCPNSQYLNRLTNNCQFCQFPCLECINTNSECTFCYQGLQLINNTCSCGFNQELKQLSEGQTSQFVCIEAMQTKLAVVLQITNYELTFTFDQSLKQIDFSKNPIQNLLKIQLSNVPQSYYSFENPQINENKLTLQLNVITSFYVSIGTAVFLKTNIFESDDNRFILSSYYLTNPIQFKIGPFIFTEQQTQTKMAAVINNLKNSQYQNILTIIQQTQILFYLLNTAQPTMLFLLLKATFPPNLYIFYQIFGRFVFSDVVNYESTDYKQDFSIFGLKFDQKQVFLADNQIFKRIGFSNSFLANTSLVILKYFVIFIVYTLLHLVGLFIQYFSQRSIVNILKAKYKILQRLNAENEANLLIMFVSILDQFTAFQQDLWSVRYGYYLAITFLIVFISSFYHNYIEINNQQQIRNQYLYSYQFINRLDTNKLKLSFIGRNYFLIQLSKKYIAILVLFSLQNSPYAKTDQIGNHNLNRV